MRPSKHPVKRRHHPARHSGNAKRAYPPAAWRDRHRHSGTHRRRPHHRAVRRAQSREALAYGAGDHPAPLSLRRPGAETKRLDLAALEVDTTMTEDHLTGLVTEVFGL